MLAIVIIVTYAITGTIYYGYRSRQLAWQRRNKYINDRGHSWYAEPDSSDWENARIDAAFEAVGWPLALAWHALIAIGTQIIKITAGNVQALMPMSRDEKRARAEIAKRSL